MTNQRNLPLDLVETARQELSVAKADLEEAQAQVEDARDRVEKYENVLDFLEQHTGNGGVPDDGGGSVEAERAELVEEKPLDRPDVTIVEGAKAVLEHAGTPLKSRRIAERMMEAGFRYDRGINRLRDSIGTMLNREAKNGDTFEKHAPGLYGLRELDSGGEQGDK